ncbi:prepilin-type N-terminal cleavage/methylation domain-containing protein [Candidatus Sumerlaeota bacterium]|nr:prepilin-type N-terminal cleavage/methylation domain-containing protein [Candidatus Sumerlaeota bacterium]
MTQIASPLRPRRRALSLAELLVVLAIIAIVSLIAIPTVTTQMERARLATAQAECKALAQALEACAAIHGLYVPLQVLDDLPGRTGAAGTDVDRIDLESSAIRLIDPLIPAYDQIASNPPQPSLTTTDARGRILVNDWAGPFMEFRRATHTPNPQNSSDARLDFPLDPWGQPYRLFSGEGVVGSGANEEEIEDPENLNTSFGNGVLTSNEDNFDRYAVVSTGRDMMWDATTTLVEGDDIVHLFGIAGYETGLLTRFPSQPPVP